MEGGVRAGPAQAGGTRPLYVPVRSGPAGLVVRLWRTPAGGRTAVAFTSDRRLRAALGPCHPWIRLSPRALRDLAAPLGATSLTVDPLLFSRPADPADPADPAGPAAPEPAAP
jgi:hypothetical protein